ncbi:MAG: hypothetical protein HRU20_12280 [Pseudomonadales bacterium]|nr:hypothetical protein [Pseudomonadales bacterium]
MLEPERNLLIVDHDQGCTDFLASIATQNHCHNTVINQSCHFPVYYSSEIDIITMEVFMPIVDGIELLQFLGKQQSRAEIILISGCGPELLRSTKAFAEHLGLSVKATLAKPFSLAAFNHILKNNCKASQ